MIQPGLISGQDSKVSSAVTGSSTGIASVAIMFHRFGPYHHARLVAAADRCRIAAIEATAVDTEYLWCQPETTGFHKWTLFQRPIERGSVREFEKRLDSVLRQVAPSVVFIPGWGTWWAVAALRSALRLGARIVVMSYSIAGARPSVWKEAIKRRIVGLCSAALVAGKPHVDYLTALGMPRERIFTGYDVVDNEYFATTAAEARRQRTHWRHQLGLPEKYFLASGRFIDVKNTAGLLQAYARYQRRATGNAWPLILLGDGPLRPQIERLVDELGLRPYVMVPGFKQYDELPVYYSLAGAFVHASTADTWGLVVNEAMACGLPVLVSERCGCAPDLVQPGQNGFTFDPSDPERLAQLMWSMASDDCDRIAMGETSRRIIDQWAPSTFAESLVEAGRAALGAPERRAPALERLLLWALAHR